MKKLFTIAILGLIISAPAWAEQVYTNSSLRKYDTYRSPRSPVKAEEDVSESTTNTTTSTDTDENAETQGEIIIADQKMSGTNSNDGGTDTNYAWQVQLTNTFAVSKQADIEFNLLDKEGAILSAAKGGGTIGTDKTETFSGTGMIDPQLALQVVRTSVRLTAK
ncbi:MAG: hypothetical protein J7L25_13915 [Deltaproteobacteria bacterium]|nr:hypothetical protein [Candidatus Tharpella aukensis]